MDNQTIQKIIAEKIPCYFISPHLDDSVFSAGDLMAYLSKYTRVESVSVFTKHSTSPYSFSVRQFLRQCGYKDAEKLYGDRGEEDRYAHSFLGITPHYLGYVDALWRKIDAPGFWRGMFSHILPEFLHVYPTYRVHIVRGKISSHDTGIMRSLGEDLKALAAKEKQFFIFCPLAVKTHIDHVLVREVCLQNFKNVILWSDFPYNVKNSLGEKDITPIATEAFRFEGGADIKLKMIKAYTSQVKAMFPDGNIPVVPEVYYTPKN